VCYVYVCVCHVCVYVGHVHVYVIHVCPMAWLRLVGSLKLQVSFAKEPCKRDYILQRRPNILRSLLIAATPYVVYMCHMYVCHNHSYVCRVCHVNHDRGSFAKIALLKRRYSAKETYNLIDPTDRRVCHVNQRVIFRY